jgi:predicted lipoprotein with Yx(FWY)xxD motif
MKIIRITIAATLAIGLGAGPALAAAHGNALVHSREFRGQVYMMNQQHLSLYYFENDGPSTSNCYGECAINWPPALLDAGADLGENYTLIERTDGTMQAAFKGQPLYRFSADNSPGDINGDGIGGVWRLAKP